MFSQLIPIYSARRHLSLTLFIKFIIDSKSDSVRHHIGNLHRSWVWTSPGPKHREPTNLWSDYIFRQFLIDRPESHSGNTIINDITLLCWVAPPAGGQRGMWSRRANCRSIAAATRTWRFWRGSESQSSRRREESLAARLTCRTSGQTVSVATSSSSPILVVVC